MRAFVVTAVLASFVPRCDAGSSCGPRLYVDPDAVADEAVRRRLSPDGGFDGVADPSGAGTWRVLDSFISNLHFKRLPDGGYREACVTTFGKFLPADGGGLSEAQALIPIRLELGSLPDGGVVAGRPWIDPAVPCGACPRHPHVGLFFESSSCPIER